MSVNALSLDDCCWLHILSFAAFSYSEAFLFCLVSVYFRDLLFNYLNERSTLQYWNMLSFETRDSYDSFWAGFGNYFPILNLDLKPKDVFAYHLLESLKRFKENKERTDRVLFYLADSRAFDKGEFLQEWNEEFQKSMIPFVLDHLNDYKLYAFLEIRREKVGALDDTYLFTQMMFQQYGQHMTITWQKTQFNRHLEFIKNLAALDQSGLLNERLIGLVKLYENPQRFLKGRPAIFTMLMFCAHLFVPLLFKSVTENVMIRNTHIIFACYLGSFAWFLIDGAVSGHTLWLALAFESFFYSIQGLLPKKLN